MESDRGQRGKVESGKGIEENKWSEIGTGLVVYDVFIQIHIARYSNESRSIQNFMARSRMSLTVNKA